MTWKEDLDDFQCVAITSSDDLVIYCVVQYLMPNPTQQMRLSKVGDFVSSLLRPAPKLRSMRKLRQLLEAYPDKFNFSKEGTTDFVTLCSEPPNLPAIDPISVSDDNEVIPTSDDSYYFVVEYLLNKGGRPALLWTAVYKLNGIA